MPNESKTYILGDQWTDKDSLVKSDLSRWKMKVPCGFSFHGTLALLLLFLRGGFRFHRFLFSTRFCLRHGLLLGRRLLRRSLLTVPFLPVQGRSLSVFPPMPIR